MSREDQPRNDLGGGSSTELVSGEVLIESLPEIFFLFDAKARPVQWNRRAEAVTGYSADEIVDKHALEFIAAPDRRRVEAAFALVLAAGKAQVEGHLLTRTGDTIPYLLAGRRVFLDGHVRVLGFGIDISDRARAQAALRASEMHYRALVEQSIVGVYVIRDGIFSYVNRRLAEMFGYREREIVDRLGPIDLLAPEEHEAVRERIRQRLEGEVDSAHYVARGLRKDGSVLWVEIHGTRIDLDGEHLITGSVVDITQRKEAENKVRRLAERLTTTLESITDAFYTLDREWRFTYINREAERVLGRDREQLLGSVLWEQFAELHDTALEREFRHAMEADESVGFEFLWSEPEQWHDYHAYPFAEGLTVLFRDISKRKRDEEQIEFLALYDPLTGLPNRRLLTDRLQHTIDACGRSGHRVGMLFLDLDDFKSVNDVFGHETGDVLLQRVATRLRSCLRSNDTVARFGGDEFAIVVGDLAADPDRAASEAAAVGEKIRVALAEPYRLAEREYHGTASIGLAVISGPEEDADRLLKRADLAMYRAKAGGRNNVRPFEPGMEAAVTTRMQLEAELRRAIENRQIQVHYQPQVDSAGRLTGAEALARWRNEEGRQVPPAEFIPVAEQSGLIAQLGHLVLETACRQLADWARKPGMRDIAISVNVSARQLHHPEFVDNVVALGRSAGVSPGLLRLELTESVLLENMEDTRARMAALSPHGIRFSLDDFGTGYSSLAYLKNFPLECLKIDQSFVRGMATDSNDAAIARAVIAIAESLGLGVIAEGVEVEEVRLLLEQFGCREYQGFLFGRPLPIDQFEQSVTRYLGPL